MAPNPKKYPGRPQFNGRGSSGGAHGVRELRLGLCRIVGALLFALTVALDIRSGRCEQIRVNLQLVSASPNSADPVSNFAPGNLSATSNTKVCGEGGDLNTALM